MQKSELVEKLKNGSLDNILADIYSDENKLDYQNARYIAASEKFEQLYGGGDISIFSAPGRVEIIGNHTDHQHGRVIAASVNADAIAVVKKSDDALVKIVSGDNPEIKIDINALDISEEEEKSTSALIKGMLNGLKGMGYALGGFCAYITSLTATTQVATIVPSSLAAVITQLPRSFAVTIPLELTEAILELSLVHTTVG